MTNHDQAAIIDPRAAACRAVEKLCAEWKARGKCAPPALPKPIPDYYDSTNYSQVLEFDDVAALEKLIANGFNIRTDDDAALRWMASYGHIEMVNFLLDHGADIHANDDAAVQWAADNGQSAMVRLLIAQGADIHSNDNLALQWAAEEKHFDTVDVLVEHGAPLDALTPKHRQPYEDYKQEKMPLHVQETLSDIFKAVTWVGHTSEMAALWQEIPESLQAGFDFQHVFAAANIQSLKQQAKPRITFTK